MLSALSFHLLRRLQPRQLAIAEFGESAAWLHTPADARSRQACADEGAVRGVLRAERDAAPSRAHLDLL
jgi:hypothetical protein